MDFKKWISTPSLSDMFFMHCKYNNLHKITWRSAIVTICSQIFQLFCMYSISLIPCDFLNNKLIWKFTYQNKFVAYLARTHCFQKSGLNIRLGFLNYIVCRPYIFFVRKFAALSREPYFSCIHKHNCWYHDCAIEQQLIGLFLKKSNFNWFI